MNVLAQAQIYFQVIEVVSTCLILWIQQRWF